MRYLDKDGNEIDVTRWVELQADEEYTKIARTDITPDVAVETVWCGMPPIGSKPHLFEALILGGERDEEFRPYATEQEAVDGHDALVRELRGITVTP